MLFKKKKADDKEFKEFLKKEFEHNEETSDILLEKQTKPKRKGKRKV